VMTVLGGARRALKGQLVAYEAGSGATTEVVATARSGVAS